MKPKDMLRLALVLAFLGTGFLPEAGVYASSPAQTTPATSPINHIIVIYLENRGFDNLYGTYPGANGLANAGPTATQVDKDGKPYTTLPPVMNTNQRPAVVDTKFPATLPNQPFDIGKYIPANVPTGDLVHRYYQEQMQIDGGKMDKFAAVSDAAGLVMGYYDGSQLPMWQYAKNFTLTDNFFHAAFGGSFLNHFWLVCACSPKWPNAPANIVAQVDASGSMVKDGQVTPDGFGINTAFTINSPHPATVTDTNLLVPQQTMPNIGDRLSEKNVSWAWYSAGWNDAIAGKADKLFQFHHQPLAFFQNYADGTPGRAQHLKDYTDLVSGIQSGNLPAVSFYKPLGADNEHPGYTDLLSGDQKTADLIKTIQGSPVWKDTAVIVTYDENGGFWDHVAPPKVDKWGPGTRVPTFIISPFAKKGFVDHTSYDTTSILKFIENRYGLQPLSDRDAKASDFTAAFNFSSTTSGTGASGGVPQGGVPASGQGNITPLVKPDSFAIIALLLLSLTASFIGWKRFSRKRSKS